MNAEAQPGLERIQIATDFSDNAEAAVAWAAEIARPHGARLRLVHTLTLPTATPDYLPAQTDFGEELRHAALSRLEESADELRDQGLEVEVDLRVGIPSQAILAAAKEHPPDLLVLGTRGLTGLAHLLLGSTAERVVQRAECPVLTIHPGDADRHRQIRTVIVPTDFSEDASQAIECALRLLSRLDHEVELVLLNAYHLPIEYTAYGPIPTSVNYLKDVASEAQDRLREIAEGFQREGLKVETVCREGFAPDVILEEAESREADLIAMGTHGRSGLSHLLLGSTAERVVQKAPCPVMTIRRREKTEPES